MNVTDTVTTMLKAWPTMYATRADALMRLFDYYATMWVGGELVFEDPRELSADRDPLRDEAEALKALAEAKSPEKRSSAVSELLFARRENAKVRFVLDNADVLALDDYSDLTFVPRFNGRHFDDMPDNVKPDWLEAAKDLAFAIIAHEYIPTRPKKSPEYIERDLRDLEASKKVANQFLERFKVKEISTAEREARMKELAREAAALGLALVEKPTKKGKAKKTAKGVVKKKPKASGNG